MNAAEAKVIAEQNLKYSSINLKPLLNAVYKRIAEFAIQGKRSVINPFKKFEGFYSDVYLYATMQVLLDNGYTVTLHDNPDPLDIQIFSYWEISW